MSEILHIKNLGPIKDVRLELKKFNVIIGDNATGKSTVIKLLSICRYFSYISGVKKRFTTGLFDDWGFEDNFIYPKSYIYYECENYIFELGDKDDIGTFFSSEPKLTPLSEKFKSICNELDKIDANIRKAKNKNDDSWNIPPSFFQNTKVSEIMNYPFFIPAERALSSIFSLGKGTVQNMNGSLYNQLYKITEVIAREFTNLTPLGLGVSYSNHDGKGFIQTDDNKIGIRLANAATGYQSAVPIYLATNYYSNKRKRKTFIIEEIELNLFPKNQKLIIEYLATVIYQSKLNHQLTLTTHSPYTLTSINNLIYAYHVGQELTRETNNIIPENYWLNPKDVSCYLLKNEEGGSISENIMDEELQQIKVEKIDEISEVLSNQWHQLAEISSKKNK